MPTFVHGVNAKLSLGGTALEGIVESATMNLARELAEIRVWGGSIVQRLAGCKDATFTVNGVWDATLDATIYAAYEAATAAALVFMPDGVTPPTYTVDVWITSYAVTSPSNGAVTWTLGISAAGGVVRT